MILVRVTKQIAEVLEKEPVVSGSVGVYRVVFRFGDEWAGVTPTVVFRAGEVERSAVLTGGQCTIPWEVLAAELVGRQLSVGVYGVKGEDMVLPTTWTQIGTIREGTELGGNTEPPTPDVYQQFVDAIHADAVTAEEAARAASEDAETAMRSADTATEARDNALDADESAHAAKAAAESAAETATTAKQSAELAAAQADAAQVAADISRETAETAAQEAAVSAGNAQADAARAETAAMTATAESAIVVRKAEDVYAAATVANNAASEAVSAWTAIKNGKVLTAERVYPTSPQIDLTVEEATQAIAITEIGGVALQDFGFTEMRFYCENAVQTAADASELRAALNRSASAMYTAATDFLVATRQLYTSGAVSLKDGTAWTASPQTNRAWRGAMNVQIYPNLEYGRTVRTVNFWSNSSLIPVGTKIQVWLR